MFMMRSSLEGGPVLSESLERIRAVSIEAFRHSKLAPFDASLAALLSVASHNGSAEGAALLHVSADRKIHVTASASSSGFADARTLRALSDEEFAWLGQVNAPKVVPFDALRESWQRQRLHWWMKYRMPDSFCMSVSVPLLRRNKME
jgi:hypothetical protein